MPGLVVSGTRLNGTTVVRRRCRGAWHDHASARIRPWRSGSPSGSRTAADRARWPSHRPRHDAVTRHRLVRRVGVQHETRRADAQPQAIGLQADHLAMRPGAHQRGARVHDVRLVDLVSLDAQRIRQRLAPRVGGKGAGTAGGGQQQDRQIFHGDHLAGGRCMAASAQASIARPCDVCQ